MGEVKLNLGSGNDYKKGWVNVDLHDTLRKDKTFDLRKRFPYKSGSISCIKAQDILEHFTKKDGENFLTECWRVLKLDGILTLRVPDIYKIFESFRRDPKVLMLFIYGNTINNGELGAHKYGYTQKMLRELLLSSGFVLTGSHKETTNIVVTAKKVKKVNYKLDVLISGQDSGGLGGAEKFFENLGQDLKQNGDFVRYLVWKDSDYARSLSLKKYELYCTSVRMDVIGGYKGLIKFFFTAPYALVEYAIILSKKTKNKRVILMSGISDKILISPLAKLMGYLVVWIEFGPLDDVLKRNFFIPKILYRLVRPFSDLVIVPTEYTKMSYIRNIRISESKINLIPCGIRLLSDKKINSILKSRERIRKKLKLNENFVVGMVSRLQEEKGQDTLIKTISKLDAKIPNLKIVLVGEGGYSSTLKKLIPLKYARKVIMTGYVKDQYSLMSAFDVFVFPSRWELEGFGIVLVEAMMMKVPIVANNFGPIPEVVGNAGMLVHPSTEGLSDGIYKLYKSSLQRKKLVKNGKERVKQYNIRLVAKKYRKLILDLITVNKNKP